MVPSDEQYPPREPIPRQERFREQFEEIDRRIADMMDRWSVSVLRVALGVVFVWFGGL